MQRGPLRLFVTEVRLAVLRAVMAGRRLATLATFAHVRQELGIDLDPEQSPLGSPARSSSAR